MRSVSTAGAWLSKSLLYMTRQGLANLFDGLKIERHYVPRSGAPIWALHWIVQAYAHHLAPEAKQKFLSMRMRDLLAKAPIDHLQDPIVRVLSDEGNWSLASTTAMILSKPATNGD